MEILEILKIVVVGFISSGILAVIVAWLSQNIVKKWLSDSSEKYKTSLNIELENHKKDLNIDLEKFKETLKHENAKEIQQIQAGYSKDIERLRSELSLLSAKGSKQFEILQTRRASKIEELYIAIVHYSGAFNNFARPIRFENEEEDEIISDLNKNFFALNKVFYENQIYLKSDLCESVRQLLDESFDAGRAVVMSKKYNSNSPQAIQMRERDYENLQNIWRNRMPNILTKITDEFRQLLGVEESPSISEKEIEGDLPK